MGESIDMRSNMSEKPTDNTISIEKAYLKDGEIGAVKACILKYARTIDSKDSARDMKPLISGLFDAIDRLKSLETVNPVNKTALFQILERADSAKSAMISQKA